MQDAEVLISRDGGKYYVAVHGRANFQCGGALREFAGKLDDSVESVVVDLRECLAMDSTFMGILSMIGLKMRKKFPVKIANAGDFNRGLLRGLGVEKVFEFIELDSSAAAGEAMNTLDKPKDKLFTAETVRDAHQTLIDIDCGNQKQFSAVVKMASDEAEALRKKSTDA